MNLQIWIHIGINYFHCFGWVPFLPSSLPLSWFFKGRTRTFLVVQWLRIHLAMQGILVPFLVQEDPTCRGATEPALWSPRATTPEAQAPRASAPQQEKPWQWVVRALQPEKALAQHWRPSIAKNKDFFKKRKPRKSALKSRPSRYLLSGQS